MTVFNWSSLRHWCQARSLDGSIFPPINELLKSAKTSVDWLENPSAPERDSQSQWSRRPPHARLPDEVDDELPVYDANERLKIFFVKRFFKKILNYLVDTGMTWWWNEMGGWLIPETRWCGLWYWNDTGGMRWVDGWFQRPGDVVCDTGMRWWIVESRDQVMWSVTCDKGCCCNVCCNCCVSAAYCSLFYAVLILCRRRHLVGLVYRVISRVANRPLIDVYCVRWRRGVVVASLVRSTRLTYAEPG